MKSVMPRESKAALRRRIRETRDREWIRDAVRLRRRSPAESLRLLFDLTRFAELAHRSTRTGR